MPVQTYDPLPWLSSIIGSAQNKHTPRQPIPGPPTCQVDLREILPPRLCPPSHRLTHYPRRHSCRFLKIPHAENSDSDSSANSPGVDPGTRLASNISSASRIAKAQRVARHRFSSSSRRRRRNAMTAINSVADLAIDGAVATVTIDSPPVNALSQTGP